MVPPLPFQVEMWPMLILVLLPFLGAGILLGWGKKWKEGGAWVAIGIMGTCLALGLLLLSSLDTPLHYRQNWISLGDFFSLTMGLRVDTLALSMVLLITGISLLVLVFSRVYMQGEAHLNRYWGYLLLFCGAMLLIILADNLLLLYMAWEGVGLSSYLLIGFWYQKEAPARASQQAFLVNRIGDLGFLIGMMVLIAHTGTLDLQTLAELFAKGEMIQGQWVMIGSGASPIYMQSYWLPVLSIALFGGCIGKSAQFPLQIWLPDAMEGPTPVSSLIHAATMVAAGVYLMVRVFFLLDETALTYLAFTGALTALMAGLAAMAQWDIKRVLAYSTISQLGYMVMAVGVGATDMAMLHLFTHAFFKCALFLTAGVIIHSLHHAFEGISPHPDAQDLRNMGGLRVHLPQTFWLYILPMLALAGLPLTSGFLSKDGILMAAWTWAGARGGQAWIIPLSGLATAGLTAFYMARHAWLIWGGKKVRGLENEQGKIPAAPFGMRLPLYVLAMGSLWLFFSLNPLEAAHSWLIQAWTLPGVEVGDSAHTWVPLLSIILALLGLGLGTSKYRTYSESSLLSLLQSHFYQQQLYQRVFERGGLWISKATSWWDKWVIDGVVNAIGKIAVHDYKSAPLPSLSEVAQKVDDGVVDGLVNGLVSTISATGRLLRKMQSGRLQSYLLLALAGMLLLISMWLV